MKLLQVSKKHISIVSLVILAIVVLVIRNPDPLINPVLYTEDGVWSGLILSNGLFHTMFSAKDGYYVVGNVILLAISICLSYLFSGNFLLLLPQTVAIVSYFYYAIIAVCLFIATKKVFNKQTSFLLYATFLLIPIGSSQNEIYGRLSNIGYVLPVLVSAVLIIRFYSSKKIHKFIIDLIVIICILTNPFCFVFIPMYLLVVCLKSSGKYLLSKNFSLSAIFSALKKNILENWSLYLFFVMFIFLVLNSVKTTTPNPNTFSFEKVVMAFFGRITTYPFLFYFYRGLNNTITVFFSIMLISLVIISLYYCKDRQKKYFLILTFIVFMFYSLATIIMRPLLPYQLGSYLNTFPDRYFLGPNIFIVFTILIALSNLMQYVQQNLKIILKLLFVVFGIIYFVSYDLIFETNKTRFPIQKERTFVELLSDYTLLQNNTAKVPIYPEGWNMIIPAKLLIETLERVPFNDRITVSSLSDLNWENGVLRTGNTLLFRNYKINFALLKDATKLKAKEVTSNVMGIDYDDKWIRITIDSNKEAFAHPNTIEVLK